MKDHSKAIISGSLAGAFGYTLTLPLDYIKQHMQNNVSFASIVKNTSPRNYMSGGLIGISTIMPQMAIKYLGFQQFNQHIDNKMGAAFCAGLVDGAFLGPILAMQSFKRALYHTHSQTHNLSKFLKSWPCNGCRIPSQSKLHFLNHQV